MKPKSTTGGVSAQGEPTVVTGLKRDKMYTLVTYVLDAQPDHIMELPKRSIWPFISAIA